MTIINWFINHPKQAELLGIIGVAIFIAVVSIYTYFKYKREMKLKMLKRSRVKTK